MGKAKEKKRLSSAKRNLRLALANSRADFSTIWNRMILNPYVQEINQLASFGKGGEIVGLIRVAFQLLHACGPDALKGEFQHTKQVFAESIKKIFKQDWKDFVSSLAEEIVISGNKGQAVFELADAPESLAVFAEDQELINRCKKDKDVLLHICTSIVSENADSRLYRLSINYDRKL